MKVQPRQGKNQLCLSCRSQGTKSEEYSLIRRFWWGFRDSPENSFPWSRRAYEALCAEETIELADSALYRAKAGGRNQGVGILPSDGAAETPNAITLEALQSDNGVLTRTVKVKNSGGGPQAFAENVLSNEPRIV